MKKFKNFLNGMSKPQKITFFVVIICAVLALSIGIPTLANLVNLQYTEPTVFWDGTVATSYHSGNGTEEDPYVIANGGELAFLSNQLASNNYDNTFFSLSDNILLNEGVLKYNANDGITYILDGTTYYVEEYTNNYYDNIARTGNAVGTLNIFPSLDGFSGTFLGNAFTISGSYVTASDATELGLFTDFSGDISNLQVINSVVYGGVVTGGIASSAENATFNNVLFDGYVVGTEKETSQTITLNPPDLLLTLFSATSETVYIDILNTMPFLGGEIVNQTISGYFSPVTGAANKMQITVNGYPITTGNNAAPFGPDTIGTTVQNLPVVGEPGQNGSVNLTTLEYVVTYNYAATGGIVGHASGTTFDKVINKSEVSGEVVSGGIVGTATGTIDIEKSYNNGIIRALHAGGGLVGKLEKSSGANISGSYNTGSIEPANTNSGGLVGISFNNSGSVNLTNVFNTANNHTLGTIQHSTVNVTNSHYIYDTPVGSGTISGNFTQQTDNVLQEKTLLTQMGYDEYIDEDDYAENPEHCWVYKDNEYPLLYTDTKLKPLANIYIDDHIFSDLTEDLATTVIKNNITFRIEAANIFLPITDAYYYVSNSNIALTKTELEAVGSWTTSSGINQITTEGSHVIYVKVLDSEGNVSYLNTDILILDKTAPTGTVTLAGEGSWTDLRSNLNNIELVLDKEITVTGEDLLSGIAEISYYVSEDVLTSTDLDNLTEETWETYENLINGRKGANVYYIRIKDFGGNIAYLNTDYIILNGYSYSDMYIGRNSASYEENTYLANNSLVSIAIDYSAPGGSGISSNTHNLIASVVLPENTRIVLMDKITSKIYEYTTDSGTYDYTCVLDNCKVIYPFALFKELGNINDDLFYEESTYHNNGTIQENFKIILDFSKTNISTDYSDVKVYLELRDTLGEVKRPTIADTIKSFNLIASSGATVALTTDFSGTATLNRDSYSEINLQSIINYQYRNEFPIIDTRYEAMTSGLIIRLTDSSGTTLSKEHLENAVFSLGNVAYPADNNNVIRIPLNNGITNSNPVLKIATSEHTTTLEPGTYYLKINAIYSYNGHYEGSIRSNEIVVPVTVLGNETTVTHSFDMVQQDYLINKVNGEFAMTFNQVMSGNFTNPSIKVTLYKKDTLSAYNQNYTAVDLLNFITNSLDRFGTNTYEVPLTAEEVTLNLNLNNFAYHGYKLVFDLYEGNQKVDTIKKYFIVK